MFGAALLASMVQPRIGAPGTRLVDAGLVLCLAVALCQLVPLPPSLRLTLSPVLPALDRSLHLDAPLDSRSGPPAPLTVDPVSTASAAVLVAAIIAIFWSARTLFELGPPRRIARTIAVCGAVAAVLSILQHATAPKLIYWIWRPVNPGGMPYGPFVSRNDLAAWLVMALPLTLGYILSRAASRSPAGRGTFDGVPLGALVDETTIWLLATIAAMAAGLLAAISRSGLIAGVVATVVFIGLSRSRLTSRGQARLLGGIALVAAVGAMYVNSATLATRLDETMRVGVGGRREIWALTWTIVQDFWRVGVGVGAYERAMSIYQPPHLFAFNHAHDEYLQIVAEGGVVLAAAVLLVVVAGAYEAAKRLAADRSPIFWTRVGAASGIVAIGVQNIWETGLRMPANAVLFAVCAALALHGRAPRT